MQMALTQALFWLGVAIVSGGIMWFGATLLEDSTDKIASALGVSQAIKGGIITSIATSFPEFAVAVISTLLHGKFAIGMGAVIGTEVYNVLVIPGIIALGAGTTKTTRSIVYRDAQFFILAGVAFLLTLSFGALKGQSTGPEVFAKLTPLLVAPLILLYLLYVFFLTLSKKQNSETKRVSWSPGNMWKQVGKLVLGLAVVLVGVEAIVRSIEHLGVILNVPKFLLSVVVIASLTSFPDTWVSYKAAKRGEGTTALSNVFGSNSFDLIVSLPAGVITASLVASGVVEVKFIQGVPMLLFMILATSVTLYMLATNFRLRRREGVMLLGTYVLFVVWIVLEAFGVTNLLSAFRGFV